MTAGVLWCEHRRCGRAPGRQPLSRYPRGRQQGRAPRSRRGGPRPSKRADASDRRRRRWRGARPQPPGDAPSAMPSIASKSCPGPLTCSRSRGHSRQSPGSQGTGFCSTCRPTAICTAGNPGRDAAAGAPHAVLPKAIPSSNSGSGPAPKAFIQKRLFGGVIRKCPTGRSATYNNKPHEIISNIIDRRQSL